MRKMVQMGALGIAIVALAAVVLPVAMALALLFVGIALVSVGLALPLTPALFACGGGVVLLSKAARLAGREWHGPIPMMTTWAELLAWVDGWAAVNDAGVRSEPLGELK